LIVSPTITTFLFEAANFLVLAGVLGWLFFSPVRKAIAERADRIIQEQAEADKKLAEAEHAKQEIDEAKSNLQKELNRLRSQELESARTQAQEILEGARTQALRELELTRRQAESLSETQWNRLSRAVAFASAEAVGQLLDQLRGPDLEASLMQSACQRLDELPKEELTPVQIESARPLSDAEKSALNEALGAAASSTTYRVVADLGTGVRVLTGRGLIDASSQGLVSFARQSLIKEMNHCSELGARGADATQSAALDPTDGPDRSEGADRSAAPERSEEHDESERANDSGQGTSKAETDE
jgi:F0F1-type ATP synthase membrane subunit b/b'